MSKSGWLATAVILALPIATVLLAWKAGLQKRGTRPSATATLLAWAGFLAMSAAALWDPGFRILVLLSAFVSALVLAGLTLARWLLWFESRSTPVANRDILSRKGTLIVARVRGVPITVHWSVVVVVGFIALFAGFSPLGTLSGTVAYLLLLVLHEFGHFAAARACGLQVIEVRFNGEGGWCWTEGPRGRRDGMALTIGGVAAEFVVLVAAVVFFVVLDPPSGPVTKSAFNVLVLLNAVMIVGNLVPFRTSSGLMSDGYQFREYFRHGRLPAADVVASAWSAGLVFPPETRLLALAGFAPAGFVGGIEILNDATTPMDLVVDTLMRNLRFDQEEATRTMFAIHRGGGVLLPFADPAWAQAVAEGISGDAMARGKTLVCRAVQATAATN